MINLFKNKLLNYKLEKDASHGNIIHNNNLPLKDATSVGFLFYVKDQVKLQNTLQEIRILDKILPKSVKNLEIIFISEFAKADYEIPFNCKLIPISKIEWSDKYVQDDLQIFVQKPFDYLFTFAFTISKILDQLSNKSHATCRVSLGELQDEDSCEMKLIYDQVSFTERVRAAVEILHRM